MGAESARSGVVRQGGFYGPRWAAGGLRIYIYIYIYMATSPLFVPLPWTAVVYSSLNLKSDVDS